jgi:hypothetical protein
MLCTFCLDITDLVYRLSIDLSGSRCLEPCYFLLILIKKNNFLPFLFDFSGVLFVEALLSYCCTQVLQDCFRVAVWDLVALASYRSDCSEFILAHSLVLVSFENTIFYC